MALKRRYSFKEEKDARGGKLAAGLAAASFICFLVLVVISFIKNGDLKPYAGGAALSAALIAVYGFYMGMKSFAERGARPFWAIAGSIGSGAMMICWLTVFLNGLS